jgi:hypothetical protein
VIGALVLVALASLALAASGQTGGFTPVFTFTFLAASGALVLAVVLRRSRRETKERK